MVSHPQSNKGALTIDQVRPNMILYMFNSKNQLWGRLEVKSIKKVADGSHALNGIYISYDANTGRWGELLYEENYSELGSNLGLEPGLNGYWSDVYSLDEILTAPTSLADTERKMASDYPTPYLIFRC